MTPKHQAPRGTRDLLPGELERWQWVEARAREVLARYGYGEIRTPMFEDYELFARTSGEASEMVQKEMYRFKDLKGRDLALRPEGTAGVCRAFLEHGLAGQGRIHRLWYLGPMFRYGRPQKGRYRQFWQIGAAVLARLDAAGVKHETDHGLVRGLDYYTRTTFEVHDRSLGAQSALGGGGRYDGLIEDLGGPPTPGVGFSIGLDRVLLTLEQRDPAGMPVTGGVYVAAIDATRIEVPALVRALRRDFAVDCDLEERGFGAQMKAAGKSGARLLVLLGEEEWKRGEVVIKDLGSGDQQAVRREQLEDT